MKKLVLASLVAVSALGAVSAAVAQPPPPGWVGPHYFWHGHHYHHRSRWHGGWRYY
jgi:Spy/CpxP family protein refolding chaperone